MVLNNCKENPCKWLRKTECVGYVGEEGMVILGNCGLLGDTAYDRRCENCGQYVGVRP